MCAIVDDCDCERLDIVTINNIIIVSSCSSYAKMSFVVSGNQLATVIGPYDDATPMTQHFLPVEQ